MPKALVPMVAREYPTFHSLRAAVDFFDGYCVPRVIVEIAPSRFTIMPRSTARNLGLEPLRLEARP